MANALTSTVATCSHPVDARTSHACADRELAAQVAGTQKQPVDGERGDWCSLRRQTPLAHGWGMSLPPSLDVRLFSLSLSLLSRLVSTQLPLPASLSPPACLCAWLAVSVRPSVASPRPPSSLLSLPVSPVPLSPYPFPRTPSPVSSSVSGVHTCCGSDRSIQTARFRLHERHTRPFLLLWMQVDVVVTSDLGRTLQTTAAITKQFSTVGDACCGTRRVLYQAHGRAPPLTDPSLPAAWARACGLRRTPPCTKTSACASRALESWKATPTARLTRMRAFGLPWKNAKSTRRLSSRAGRAKTRSAADRPPFPCLHCRSVHALHRCGA